MWIHRAPDAPMPTGPERPLGQGDGSVQPGLSCVREKVEGPWVSCPSSLPGPGFLGASDVPSLQPSRCPTVRLGPAPGLPLCLLRPRSLSRCRDDLPTALVRL